MMDEFELFKARASGCEITLHDFDKLSRNSLGGKEDSSFEAERRRSKRTSRHSSRRNSRKGMEQTAQTHLDVTVEIQPPSPILDKKENEESGSHSEGRNINSERKHSRKGSGDKGGSRRNSVNNRSSTHNNSNFKNNNNNNTQNNSSNNNTQNNSNSQNKNNNNTQNNNNNDTNELSQCDSATDGAYHIIPHSDIRCHEDGRNNSNQRSNNFNNDDQFPDNDWQITSQSPAIYRVRSFTTKKGEIVSRGDSFKAYSRRNSNLLSVTNPPSFRRSSEAVPSLGSSLLVTSLQPGAACRRSSFTCLPQNNVEYLSHGGQRKASFNNRLARSGSIKRGSVKRSSVQSGSIKLLGASDQISNLSLEGSVLEEETVEEMVDEEEEGMQPLQEFQVVVMGGSGVGKSTLVNQLMTSEYLANKENNDQDVDEERVISVVLDELETAIHFNEIPSSQSTAVQSEPLPDAYLLIFSVTERASFAFVKSCLNSIHESDPRFQGCHFRAEKDSGSKGCPFNRTRAPKNTSTTTETHINPITISPALTGMELQGAAVDSVENKYTNGGANIGSDANNVSVVQEGRRPLESGGGAEQLVKPVVLILANKQDLVRNRTVSEAEVKKLTSAMRCRQAEVSALLDLNVDEVLVDLVRWLRRQGSCQMSRRDSEEEEYEDDQNCFHRAMSGLCGNIFK